MQTGINWEDIYKAQRSFLISFAFRMTGSLMDAEDIVQDTVSECMSHDFDKVTNHQAWMTRICSHKTLDLLKSGHKKRNSYIGTWLPDMIPDHLEYGSHAQQEHNPLEMAESLTISFLVLLQTLQPVERAVFLLKDVFDYPFKDVAQLLGKTKPACRKIAQRARMAINSKEHKYAKPFPDAEKLIRRFFAAAQAGDQAQLEALLSLHSEFMSDGGGKVPAAPLIATKQKIAAFFCALQHSPIFSSPAYRLQATWINARPGMIIAKLVDGQLQSETVMSFEIEGEYIVRIFAQRNPDKLQATDAINSATSLPPL